MSERDIDTVIVKQPPSSQCCCCGSGIWAQLERQLGRKDKRISERWRNVLAKRSDVQQLVLIAMRDPNRVHQALQLQESYRQQAQRGAEQQLSSQDATVPPG